MREILFKAKRIDNGEWVEGYLFDNGFDGEEKKYFVGGLIIQELIFARLTQKPSASSRDFATRMERKFGRMILYL